MSFRCGICDTPQPVGVKPEPVVLETRPSEYPARERANRYKHKDDTDDPGGAGREIAREAAACKPCAKNHREQFGE